MNNFDFDNFFTILYVSLLIFVIVLSFVYFISKDNPPETIERDGYTYELYEESPKEFIEYNGHTYRLGDSVNE